MAMMMFAFRYSYQIWKGVIVPRLATWLVFFAGTTMSLTTYAIAENHDFRSGILNTVDTVSVVIICGAIIRWQERSTRFKSSDKWFLCGMLVIVLYGIFSGNAWNSNIFTQILICLGYIPTISHMLKEKRNTESFTAWGLNILASLFALYPAIVGGNTLSIIYAVRTIILVMFVIIIATYYEFKKSNSAQT